MDNQKLLEYISELEARLITMETFINSLVEQNGLKVQPQYELNNELKNQRRLSKSKYEKLS